MLYMANPCWYSRNYLIFRHSKRGDLTDASFTREKIHAILQQNVTALRRYRLQLQVTQRNARGEDSEVRGITSNLRLTRTSVNATVTVLRA